MVRKTLCGRVNFRPLGFDESESSLKSCETCLRAARSMTKHGTLASGVLLPTVVIISWHMVRP